MRDRVELKRREQVSDNKAILERLVDRTLNGLSIEDLALEKVTHEELLAAARKYLPPHRQSYVRLALRGQ